MGFELQRAGFEDTPYERPTQDWVCGKAACGARCALGPDARGNCPDEACRPVPSLRALRKWVTVWVGVATIGALALAAGVAPQGFRSSGELTFHHGSNLVTSGCVGCHRDAAGRSATDSSQSQLCLQCHQLGPEALDAHGVSPALLAAETARLGGSTDESQLACATCHAEHRGRNFDMTSMPNDRCQSCHLRRFDSLTEGHPELGAYPYAGPTSIRFDHRQHRGTYFKKERNYVADREFQCRDCHLPDAAGRHMVLRDFESACSSCHERQILDSGSLTFLMLQGLDTFGLEDNAVDIGEWPSEEEPLPSPFMELLLRGDEADTGYLDVFRDLDDPLDLADADADELEAVEQYAWAVKELFKEVRDSGHGALERRLQRSLGTPIARDLVGGVPPATIRAAAASWFPRLDAELGARESGSAPATELTAATDIGVEAGDPEAWLSGGGWYRDDLELLVRYRPTGHGDAFVRGWLETTVRMKKNNAGAQSVFDELAADHGPGRCLKCHTTGGEVVRWTADRSSAPDRGFTRFSHATHFSRLSSADACENCHVFGTGDAAGEDFAAMQKVQCAACHTASAAGDDCTLCHNYHAGKLVELTKP